MSCSSSSRTCCSEEDEFAKGLQRTLEDSSNNSESSGSFVAYQKKSERLPAISQDRESIAKRFESFLNAGDSHILLEQLEPMLESSTCDVESFRLQNMSDASTEELESSIKGKPAVLEYFAGYLNSIPDLIFLVHDWKIFERPNKYSCVVFKFSLSGHQILQMDTRCKAEDCDVDSDHQETTIVDCHEAAVPEAVIGKKRSRDPSVHFKEKGHAAGGRQDAKRVRGGKALGQFIADNALLSHHRVSIADVRKELSLEQAAAADDSDKYIAELAAPAAAAAATGPTITAAENKHSILSSMKYKDAMVNIRGVMRLMLNESNLIYKVHCVHFTKFG